MATPRYNRARDFGHVLQNLASFSDNQARVVTYDESELTTMDIEIRPSGGLYKGGTFLFRLKMGSLFPYKAPKVSCLSPIYHPNIDAQSKRVCLNLWSEWLPSFGLQDAIQGLLYLMYEPNLDSMLASYIHADTFAKDAVDALKGTIDSSNDRNLEVFGKGNAKDVEDYYHNLTAEKNILGGAEAAQATVPLADVFSNHVTAVLDAERMNIPLAPVDIPHASMVPSTFHSRQTHKLAKSSSIHAFMYHPDVDFLPAPQTALNDPTPRRTLQRSVTVWSQEHMAHSKPFDASDYVSRMEAAEPIFVFGRTDHVNPVSAQDSIVMEDSTSLSCEIVSMDQ